MPMLKYRIYQLPMDHPRCFRPYDKAKTPPLSDYAMAYEGARKLNAPLTGKKAVEAVYSLHNADDRPDAKVARSLSTSDLVVLFDGPDPDEPGSVYYVNTFGSVQLPAGYLDGTP